MSTSVRWDPTRQQMHADAQWRKPCPTCAHPSGQHGELQGTWEFDGDGEWVKRPHPDYRPLHFHCFECDCVWVAA